MLFSYPLSPASIYLLISQHQELSAWFIGRILSIRQDLNQQDKLLNALFTRLAEK